MKTAKEIRSIVTQARRIVIKVGSRVLIQRNGRPDVPRMRELARQIGALHREGREVVLVSSGAIGAGMEALGWDSRPNNLPDLQMAAAVGQSRLMTRYSTLFAREKCGIGQILLTHDDLRHRARHLNARNTIMNLLRNRIIPIVNENDVISVDEIKFGDNDVLASLVSLLIDADLLILLSTVNGIRKPIAAHKTRRISYLDGITGDIRDLAHGKGSIFSVGGMSTKMEAAQTVVNMGGLAAIANGRESDVILKIMRGEDVGTLIGRDIGDGTGEISRRKQWIAFFHRAQGTLVIDDGARDALLNKGRSLLPIGVKSVEGKFEKGSVVNIQGLDGKLIARGLAVYSHEQVKKIMGHKTSEIAALLGSKDYDEVVHRDHMVIMGKDTGSGK